MFTPVSGDRPYAANAVIIITDGVPRVPDDVREAARRTVQQANIARQAGINVFAVGIGILVFISFLPILLKSECNSFTFLGAGPGGWVTQVNPVLTYVYKMFSNGPIFRKLRGHANSGLMQ